MRKKYKIILILFSLILLLCIILKLTLFKKVTTVIKLNDNLIFEYEEEHYLLDNISIIDGIILDQNYLLDTSSLGTHNVIITYKDSNGWKKKYEFSYNVVDTTSPLLSISKNLYLEKGSNINNLLTNVFCGDNYDRKVDLSIDGDYDVNMIGNYDIKIIAKDDDNNITSKNATLHIYESNNRSSNTNKNTNQGIPITYFFENYKSPKTSIGLDISSYQDVYDFNEVKNAGIDFVMLRIGWGPNSDLTFNDDSKFEDYYKKAKEANLKIGIYYFSYATTLDEVDLEVNYVLDKLKDKKIDMWISYDWENWKLFKDCNMNFNDLNKMAKKFMDKLKENGYSVMNYSSKYYLENIWTLDTYNVWLAQYNDEATYEKKFNLWQISDQGRVSGINNLVDVDILIKD